MNVLKWVGTIAAIWVAVSIPAALIVGRAFKRLNHEPPQLRIESRVSEQAVTDIVNEIHRRNHLNGGAR